MTDPRTDPSAPATARHPRRKRRALRVAGWLLALPVVALLAAALMLIDRDITAPQWLRQNVEARAAHFLGGGTLSFGDITLRISRDLHPQVDLIDTVLRDATGATLARIDRLQAGLSPRGLLFERAALVQRIALTGTDIQVARDSNGAFRFAFDRPGGNGALLADGLGGLVAQIDGLRDRPALAALEHLRLDDVDLVYTDARADRVWTVAGGQFDLTTTARRTTAAIALQVAGDHGTARVDVTLDSPRDTPAADIRIAVDGLPARDLASQSAALRVLETLDAPVSARLDTSVLADGTLAPLQVQMDIGAGQITGGPDPIPINSARLAAQYDPAKDRVQITDMAVVAAGSRFDATGHVLLQDFKASLPRSFVMQMAVRNISLDPRDLYDAPLTIDRADVDIRLSLAPFRLRVGQVAVTDPKLTARAALTVENAPDGWMTRLDVQSDRLSSAALMRIWPASLRPGTRSWIAGNIAGGMLHDLTLGLRRRPDAAPTLAVTFGFADASVSYLPAHPLITGAGGFATLAQDRFSLALDAGRVTAPQGGAVDMAGSTLLIADLTRQPAQLDLDLRTSSTVTAALSLLNLQPLRLLDRANLPVTLTDGRADVEAAVSLPLRPGIRGADVTFEATASLSRIRSETLIPGRRLDSTGLMAQIDRAGLTLDGPATLDGVPLRGQYVQEFGPDSAPPRVTADVTVTPEALQTFGIALPPGAVRGRGQARIDLTLPGGAPPQLAVVSDLSGIGLSVPAINWTKPAGTRADLAVTATLGAAPQVQRLTLDAAGLRASGAVRLANGQLQTARFDRVRVSDWFDGPVTLTGRGPGQPVGVEITSGVLDLSRAQLGGGTGNGQGGPIDVALNRLDIAGGLALTDFRGRFDTTGGLTGRFDGRFNGTAPVTGRVAPRDGRTAVQIGAQDAGAVLRAGGFMQGAQGGTLDLTLLPAPDRGSYDGALAIRNLRVRDAPGVAALLDAISVVGLLQQLDGQGIAFDTVDASFRLDRDAITVTQSSAVGPGLGISLDGIYMLASKQVRFQGVVSPFYILNGIGSFLTRRGEGLIGFNFNLSGTAAAPQVSVNPLSLFTPGMFRDIFRRPPPELAQ
ncbi:DUF3971 domain-containing protein [Loktanella sp. SALINAS62]|uniref:YhdP family protein n=1 Tax=Loktanella sp. SALINAS62 TaxID=2706124 RepID=UPI001B8D35F1|nr:DUF3971 domain-containing protein [Loktanella sp. SALINAS62]MBS1301617.1 DUF3971 domain-containing protein [Loktanella sp. SALINAS62]